MKSISDLKKGDRLTNDELIQLFKCGRLGGMRRSLKTNSLVLISDRTNPIYKNMWQDDEGLWHFTAMGRKGPQSLNYLQNKTIVNSNLTGVRLFLFDCRGQNDYWFVDRVLLADEPYKETQKDEENKDRDAYVFKLLEIGNHRELVPFLLSYSLNDLVNQNILIKDTLRFNTDIGRVLINVMNNNNIHTFTGPGGWFISSTGYFYNDNSSNNNSSWGKIILNSDVTNYKVFEEQEQFLNPYYSYEDRGSSDYEFNNTVYKDKPEDSIIRMCNLSYKTRAEEEKNVSLDYLQRDMYNEPFTTLLIGPNGTGKTTILSVIQKILLECSLLKRSKIKSLLRNISSYTLEYTDGINMYKIESTNGIKTFYCDDEPVNLISLPMPKMVIASAYSLNDRFTHPSSLESQINTYEYLGIKSSNNAAMAGRAMKNMIYNILKASLKNHFLDNMTEICDFLDLEPELKIVFARKNYHELREKIIQKQVESKKSVLIDIEDIMDFFSEPDIYKDVIKFEKNSVVLQFNLTEPLKYESYYETFQLILHLFEIGILFKPNVLLKKHVFFPLKDASSGESHFITTMVNLMSKVEPGSVILIDEPETSLHPNWQYKYIHSLKTIFKRFKTCHFIMATHSPFFISDLKPTSSSIVSLKIEDKKVSTTLHEENTFGWSVEDVLYQVFNVPTHRNYYIAQDVDSILLALSTERPINEEVRNKARKLESLSTSMNDSDPLKDLIPILIKKVIEHA